MAGIADWQAQITIDVDDLKKKVKAVEGELDGLVERDYKVKLNIDTKTLESAVKKLDKMLDSIGKGSGDFKQFENLSKQLSSITTGIGKISKAFAAIDDGSGLVNNIKSIDASLTNLTNHFVSQVSDKMTSSIKEVKGTLSDVGNGKELEPLLQTIGRIESAIDNLSSSFKGIGLNMNIDFGSDKEMESKAEAKISNALQAYQRLFDHIKFSSAGGSLINQKFFDFDINQYDTAMSKLQAYRKFIENMRNEAKGMYGGKDVLYTDTDKKYWTQVSSAMGQVTKTFNEMKAAKDTNPLENIFGKTDLTEVLNQLTAIVSKLDEISVSANRFSDVFKDGLNINASLEEIDKLTSRVKELESELAKVKIADGVESNISFGHLENAEPANVSQLKKEFNDAWDEANKINSALDETKNTIASLSQMKELSNQFGEMNTKVDSLNSELVNGKITISDYKKEVKSLTSEYSKMVDIQQKREANDYKNQQSTINGYAKRLESYTKKESNYKATLERFGDDGWTSNDYLEKVNAVSAAIKQYESILNNLKAHPELVTDKELSNLDEQEKLIKDNINAIQNMTAAQKGYDKLSGEKELNKISQILSENTRMSAEARAKIQAYYNQIESGNPSMSLDKIHAEILKIVNAEEQAGRTGKSLFDIFSTSRLHQIVAQAAGMFSLYDVINVGKQGLQSIRELNTALTEMRKVSTETVQSLKNYQSTTFDTADAVGTTAKQIQNSTADYMRLGESLEEASESAKTANILLNVSEFDNIEDATKSLVSMGQAYKDLDKLTIVDKLNEVGR